MCFVARMLLLDVLADDEEVAGAEGKMIPGRGRDLKDYNIQFKYQR